MCRTTPPLVPERTDNIETIDLAGQTHDTHYKNNQAVGDTLQLPKPANTTRIAMQNPNGITTGRGGTFPNVLGHIQQTESDIFLLPETNQDTTKTAVQQQVQSHCRKTFGVGQCKVVMGSSAIPSHTQFKPGGCMAITVGDTVGRVLAVGADKLGRWVYVRYNGGAGRVVTIICTYQVCQENVRTAGPTKAITQQYSMLEGMGRHQPHRVRHHHVKDLVQFVQSCKDQGDLVVVAGDFNETIGDNGGGLTRLCSDLGLQDPTFERHGCTNFNSHSRGSKCIDYILVDPELMPSITACGYAPFNSHIVSDHRCVYIDVNTSLFFGSATVPLPRCNPRDYSSQNIHQTKPYFEHLDKHLQDHNWYEKIKTLQHCIDTNTRDDDLAEDLDRRRIAACQYAGSHLKKYPHVPWSPEVVRLRNINDLLKVAIHQKAYPEEDCTESLQALHNKLGSIGVTVPETIQDCKRFQRENLKVLRETESKELQNPTLRRKFQEAKIAAYTDSGNAEAAKILRRIQRAEATKEVYRQCAYARGKTKEGGLSYVWVPTDPDADPKRCDDSTKLVDPSQVEEAIRQRLSKHFSQSKGCNLTSPPFDTTMFFDAACERADQILAGTYDTSDLDDMTTALLECLAYTMDGEPAVDATITSCELLGKLKAWNETTSTSPMTNVHLGHGKAYLAKTNLHPESSEAAELERTRAAVIHGHVTLLNYALHFGHSYERWKRIVNAMLEKDPGNPRIHRLRVIHLYEWDFNLILCVKWRQLLHHVCDNGLINPACYGTMPGHSSLDPVFIKEMEYEISRLTRRPLVHFDNDATSCYDRIPCFLANLASRKYGMHKKVCIVQAKTLEQAKYYLRTKFGISAEYAEHTQECPWFGTGQGSGNSPFYWLLISSTLYDLYCSKTTGGAHYASPDKQLHITIHLLGFVDDVNNRTTLSPSIDSQGLHDCMSQLMEQASQDSQLWHDILVAANQELELTKCKYHVLYYNFQNNGQPSLVDQPEPPAPLTITGIDGNPVAITHVPSSKAIKYLGCHKCPRNQTDQQAALMKKCNDYARVINCSRLSRRGTQVFYQAIYRLSVGYPLPVCYFTFKELDKIQRKAHQAILSHSGFNKFTARAVVFGPEALGGAAFFHLYDEQGYGQVSHFIKFWRSPRSHPGQVLRIAVSWAQHCAGTSYSIFQNTTTSLPHFESTWLASLRQYLHAIDGSLELDNPYIPPKQREGDEYLMDIVLTNGCFKPAQIRMVNYCRLYLRAVTIADIATADGTAIRPGVFQGTPQSINVNSNWNHVHQQRPGPRAWCQWRRACRLFSTRRDQKLHVRLGHWTEPSHNLRTQWTHWFDRLTNTLYQRRVDGSFTSHQKLQQDYDKDITEANVTLPAAAVPVDVTVYPHTWKVHPNYVHWRLPPQPPPPPSEEIQDTIAALPHWESELLTGLALNLPQAQLFHIIQHQPIMIGSDGSQQDSRASFGWVLSTTDGQRLATCKGPCYGSQPTSYRAEGYGLLSACRFLLLLQDHFQLDVPSPSIVCDNRTMVNRASKPPGNLDCIYPNETLAAEWDILLEIWTTKDMLTDPHRPTFTHVKGHQDRKKPYNELSLSAQLNVDADHIANAYIEENPDKDYSHVPMLPHSGAQLNLLNGTATSRLKQRLRLARTTSLLQTHLQKKFGWSEATFHDINWESSRVALNRLKTHRTTLIKHLNDIIPVGKRVHRYDPKYPAGCPSCHEPIENADHLHLCTSPARITWKNHFLHKLREKLSEKNTPLDAMELLLEGLKSVLEGRASNTIHVPESVTTIAAAQEAIGWTELLRGRLSKAWTQHQQTHLGAFDPKVNGQTWTIDIIQFILESWLELWKSRNGDRHGRDHQSKAQAAKAQAIREMEQLYSYKDNIMPHHNWILDTPMEQRMNLKTYVLRAWINSFKPILEESYKECLATG